MNFYLKNIIKEKGYYNVEVKSSYAKNINNEYFELIFNIDSDKNFTLMIYLLIYQIILIKKILS